MLKSSCCAVLLLATLAASAAGPKPDDDGAKAASAPASAPKEGAGMALYQQSCAPCHMMDGKGVPNLQPAIAGSPRLSEANTLIDLLLLGPQRALPAKRAVYANAMPAFDGLRDAEVAAVLSYVRQKFGGAAPVSAAQVAARRAATVPSAGTK